MKLRTKFAILIAGIIIVPFILTTVFSYIYTVVLLQDEEISRNFTAIRWMSIAFSRTRNEFSFEKLTRNIPEGLDIIILDKENRIRFSSSENIEQEIYITAEELVGRLTRDFPERTLFADPFSISDNEGARVFVVVKKTKEALLSPFKIMHYTNIIFFLLVTVGVVAGVIILSTIRKSIIKLEEATKRIAGGDLEFELNARGNDELASLTRSFDSMRDKLKEEFAKRSRFLMAVSHDLSTPLTSIKGYIEAINDGLAEDKKTMEKYLSIVFDKADLLETRVEELIEFVRMETGQWRLKQEQVYFKGFLQAMVAVYKEDATIFKRHFSYSIDLPMDIKVTIDQNLLLRALENLFHNAVRYTVEEEEISLETSFTNEGIVISLHDTGAGIEEEELTYIFDPFFRGNKFNGTKGFGLGLSTVKSIINAHGWEIDVKSVVGKGTTFRISIPVEEG